MNSEIKRLLLWVSLLAGLFILWNYVGKTSRNGTIATATKNVDEATISPARPIPAGGAPGMEVKLVSDAPGGEKVYAVIFGKGDEVLSGLTDFAI